MSDDNKDKEAPEAGAASPPPAPVFGSASTFTSGGFGAFTGSGFAFSAAASAAAADKGEDGDDKPDDAECQAHFTPVVQLNEVEVTSGEEDEEVLFEAKCKLYRFSTDANEWKERGVGPAKFLQHKTTKKVRLLMRADKVMKVRANHYVLPGVHLNVHGGNDKAWVWTTPDFATDDDDRTPEEFSKPQMFAIRFGTTEKAQEFKKSFENAQQINEELMKSEDAGADKAADELASALAGAKVGEDKAEDKAEETA